MQCYKQNTRSEYGSRKPRARDPLKLRGPGYRAHTVQSSYIHQLRTFTLRDHSALYVRTGVWHSALYVAYSFNLQSVCTSLTLAFDFQLGSLFSCCREQLMVLYSIRQPHHAILEHGHSKGAARRLCEHACDAATKEGPNAFI